MSVKEQISKQVIADYNEYLKLLKKLRKKGNRGYYLFIAICAVIGGFIGFFAAMLGDKLDLSAYVPFPVWEGFEFLYFLAFLVWYLAVTVLHVIIHEGGHLVFGLLSGYEFLSFRIFSFIWVKKEGRISLKKQKVLGLMGQCLMYPPQWKEGEKYPYLLLNFGGGLFNLIFSALAALLFFTDSNFWGWLAAVFIFAGLICAVTNLIPMSIGFSNDGKNALECKKSPVAKKAFYLQLKLNANLSDGVRISDIPLEMIQLERNEKVDKSELITSMRMFEILWYLEKGMTKEAEDLLTYVESMKDKLSIAYVNSFDLMRMYFLLLEDASVEKLAAYYNVLKIVFQKNTDLCVLYVKYAYYALLSEEKREIMEWLSLSKKGKLPKKLPKVKKPVTAEMVYEQIQKIAKTHPVAGEAQLYLELTEQVKNIAEKEVLNETEAQHDN